MARIYFKKDPNQKQKKFMDACKKAGADYFEDECAVWKMPTKVGKVRCAIEITKDGKFCMGKIRESCDNFESIESDDKHFSSEAEWIIETLTKLKPLLK